MEEFAKLPNKTQKLKYVKEQILIRYLGLGWVEAYHPWSKDGYTYTAEDLLKHLVDVVIPLIKTKHADEDAPINLPKLK